VGARFFERMLAASARPGSIRFSRSRRAWLARRFLEEMESTRVALRTLASRPAGRLMTPAGRDLVAAVRRERAALLPAVRAHERFLARTAPEELRAVEAFRRALAGRPFRSEMHRIASR
jgi:hypothetical protein